VRARLGLAVTALLVPGAVLVTPGVAGAGNPPPIAIGGAGCPIQGGKGTLSPGLTPTGKPGPLKFHFAAKLGTLPDGQACSSNITFPAGDLVTGGTVTGSGTYVASAFGGNPSSCVDFDGPDVLSTGKFTIKWKMTGAAIVPTGALFTDFTNTVAGTTTDQIKMYFFTGTGTEGVSGSFTTPPSPPFPPSVILDTTIPSPPPGGSCVAGPYKKFTITGGTVEAP